MNGKKVFPVSPTALASAQEIAKAMKQNDEKERDITELFHQSTAEFMIQMNQILAEQGYELLHKDSKYLISFVKQI